MSPVLLIGILYGLRPALVTKVFAKLVYAVLIAFLMEVFTGRVVSA